MDSEDLDRFCFQNLWNARLLSYFLPITFFYRSLPWIVKTKGLKFFIFEARQDFHLYTNTPSFLENRGQSWAISINKTHEFYRFLERSLPMSLRLMIFRLNLTLQLFHGREGNPSLLISQRISKLVGVRRWSNIPVLRVTESSVIYGSNSLTAGASS